MKMMSLPERVIAWNEKRYDQVFDYFLAEKLLLEETEELYAATSLVEQLDAVGDIIFVAIGVLWKLGFTKEQLTFIFDAIPLDASLADLNGVAAEVHLIALDEVPGIGNVQGASAGLQLALFCCFNTAMGFMKAKNLMHEVFNVAHAICDSNDTKVVKGKTDPSVKANIDKGAGFVPPTKALIAIVDRNALRDMY